MAVNALIDATPSPQPGETVKHKTMINANELRLATGEELQVGF